MPKVSFRMASASRESVFGVQTNTARKIHRSDHTEGRLTTAPSGCCVRKGTSTGTGAALRAVAGQLDDGMSRKTRPVPRRGDRAFEWDAASRVEVGLARRSIVERLVWPDAVVDVAEAGGLHRERAAVVDRGAVEVLVLQRAEASLDGAVGLRAPEGGPEVAQQRLIAGERRLVGLAAKARAVVGDDGDRSGDDVDELAGVL